jgi:hypothetical protein
MNQSNREFLPAIQAGAVSAVEVPDFNGSFFNCSPERKRELTSLQSLSMRGKWLW